MHVACWNAISRIGLTFPHPQLEPFGASGRAEMIADLADWKRRFPRSFEDYEASMRVKFRCRDAIKNLLAS